MKPQETEVLNKQTNFTECCASFSGSPGVCCAFPPCTYLWNVWVSSAIVIVEKPLPSPSGSAPGCAGYRDTGLVCPPMAPSHDLFHSMYGFYSIRHSITPCCFIHPLAHLGHWWWMGSQRLLLPAILLPEDLCTPGVFGSNRTGGRERTACMIHT